MKKRIFATCLTVALAFSSSMALADSIKGRLGVTGMIGFQVPADSEVEGFPKRNMETETGFAVSGGLLYGLEKNIALEFSIAHTNFDGAVAGVNLGNFDTNTYSLGVQYRFDSPQQRLTPFIGAGLDLFSTDFSLANGIKSDVDNSLGAHISGGIDYFINRQIALTSELRMTVAPDSDIKVGGVKIGSYDPMSLSMGFGARFFFN